MSFVQEMMGWMSDKLVYDSGAELDRMSRQLRSTHAEARLDAVRQLTYMKASDAVALLLSALRDADADVRAAAARGLGYKGVPEGVGAVAMLLSDPVPEVRACAVEALDQIGMPRRQSWFRFWRDKIVVFDEQRDARVPELLGRALLDEAASVRAASLACLPRHGARGVTTVTSYLEARPEADTLEKEAPEPELSRALTATQADHRKAAVGALFRLYGERAIRSLAEALKDPSPEVRQAAVEAVTALGPRPALPELLARLEDSDEGVVVKVIEGLVCARNLGAFPPEEEDHIHAELLKAARRRAPRAQPAAAWALGELGRVESVATLCGLLDDPVEAVVIAAAQALGKINDPRAVAPLLALVENPVPGPDAVAAACRARARTADVRVIPVLVRRLFAETRPTVESCLEEALGALCAGAEPGLQEQLAAGDPATRLGAVRRAVSEPRLVMPLVGQVLDAPDEQVRQAALDALRTQGYDVTALARETLTLADKSEARRVLAINLVTALQPAEAPALLDALLADQDEPAEVYRHTVAALKRLGSPAARAALEARRQDAREPVRRLVQEALA